MDLYYGARRGKGVIIKMRQENIKKYCLTCKYMKMEDPGMRRKSALFRKPTWYTEPYCFGYDEKGVDVNRVDEHVCPMIENADDILKQIDLARKEAWLEACNKNIDKLLARKESLLKEIEELKRG